MVDFKQMPPVNPQHRIEKLKTLKRLQNGAKFEFVDMIESTDGLRILGRYLDYTGEWCKQEWDKYGRIEVRAFAELDIDWTSTE